MTIRRFQVFLFSVLAGLLAVPTAFAQLPDTVGASTDGETLNLVFNYGFFDNARPAEPPTEAEMSDLICATQDWLALGFQNTTNNPFLTLKAWSISWAEGPPEANGTDAFEVTFSGDINTIDGSLVPGTQGDLLDFLDEASADIAVVQAYILNYVQPVGGYFTNVDSAGFAGDFGPPAQDGQLEQADCPATQPPAGDTESNVTTPPLSDGNVTDPPLPVDLPDDGGNVTDPPATDGNVTGVPVIDDEPTDEPVPADTPTVAATAAPTFAPSIIYGPEGEFVEQNGTYIPDWNGTLPPEWNGTLPPGDTFPPIPSPVDGPIDAEPDELAPNSDNMAYFSIAYGFDPDTPLRAPTLAEIEDLICNTNIFFRDVLRATTEDDTVQSQGMYIDWSFDEGEEQPITVSFAANATSRETGEDVPEREVFEALQISSAQIENYLETYVLDGIEVEGSIFENVLSADVSSVENAEIPRGRIDMANCPETPAPSAMPSISPAPSLSSAPSSVPSVSPAPSLSSAPSLTPSVSQSPTTLAENDNPPLVPTDAPDDGSGGRAVRRSVNVDFIVSNLDDIILSEQVNSSGLSDSWEPFVRQAVGEISAQRPSSSTRRMLRAAGHRRLAVAYEPGTASITSIVRRDCGPNTHPDSTCHDVSGTYVLQLVNETNPDQVVSTYQQGTLSAIADDYEDLIKQQDPESPLYIGLIPPPATPQDRGVDDDDDGFPIWAIILIILLVILCLLCCIAALFLFVLKDRNQDKELEPYDEEGFVYDFLIPKNEKPQTEVDDDAATKDVDDEFEDEDVDAANRGVGGDDDQVVMVMPEDVDEFDDEPLDQIKEGDEFESDKEDEGGEEWQDGDDEERMALPAPEPASIEDLEPAVEDEEAPPDASEEVLALEAAKEASESEEASENAKDTSEADDLMPVTNEQEESWHDEDHSEKEQAAETETDADEPAETFNDEGEESEAEKKAPAEATLEDAEAEPEEWDENEPSSEAFEEGDNEVKDEDEGWDEAGDEISDGDSDSDGEGWDDEGSK